MPQLKWEINLGTLLPLILALVAAFVMWGRQDERITETRARLDAMEKRLEPKVDELLREVYRMQGKQRMEQR